MDNILEIKDIYKSFGANHALNGVNFSVERGSITGLLGPNGAGKTTLLRIINAILVSDRGEIKINGIPVSLKTSKYFGYMPEERGLYDKMRVEDQILFFGKLKGGKEKNLRKVMNEYIDLFQLADDRRRKVKELSKGNQQKVQIISTLVHEPEMVILDEPFSGFDPINGAILQELISRLHEKGTTIMLSSHNMPAIEEMCSDIALIDHGNLLVKDSIVNVKEANKDSSLLLTTTSPLNLEVLKASEKIRDIIPSNHKHHRKGHTYQVWKTEGTGNTEIIDQIAFQSDILHFEEALPSLTDIFIKYTAENKTSLAEA